MPLQSPLVERTGEPDRLQLRKKGWITINNGPALAWAEGVVSRACLGRVSTHGRARERTHGCPSEGPRLRGYVSSEASHHGNRARRQLAGAMIRRTAASWGAFAAIVSTTHPPLGW